jgi:hypothetical protein
MDSHKLSVRRSLLFALALTPTALIAQSSGSLSTRRGSGGGGSNAYDVTFTYPGTIPNLFTFPVIAFPRAINWAGNLVGSQGNCGTNPTGSVTFTLLKNGLSTGTVVINTSGAFSFTTTAGNPVSFAIGDVLSIETPATDATLASVTFTLFGSL